MSYQELSDVRERINPFIHRTPLLRSALLDELSDCNLFFKCENFQKTGSFKMRGATNAIMKLPEDQRKKGVVTHSSGNFAQALTVAARSLGIRAYIVMPESTVKVKKETVKQYGGIVTECAPDIRSREAAADKIVLETGATFIHPSNDLDVINGQATAALEMLEDCPELNFIVTPVGGGGLIAGTALAAYHSGGNCKVIGGEPAQADDAYRSLQSGQIEFNATTDTVADGLRSYLGDKNFPILQKHVTDIIRVNDEEIIGAMKLIWERMKIVVEPSSAVAFAAVLKDKERFRGSQTGIVLSGGNVDLYALPWR